MELRSIVGSDPRTESHITLTDRKTRPNIKQFIYHVNRMYPGVWPRFCPRIYQDVDRFNDYRLAAMLDASMFIAVKSGQVKMTSQLALDCFGLALAAQHGFPTFFVHKELLSACQASSPPDTIEWQSMRLPYPSMRFILPRNAMRIGTVEIAYLEMYRILPGRYRSPFFEDEQETDITQLHLSGTTTSGAKFFANRNDLYVHKEQVPIATGLYTENLQAGEEGAIEAISATIFNLIFAMAARPEYVESGKRISTHKKNRTEVWRPNILGRKYAIKREAASERGTHASPRLHWRRGHFRQQAFGIGKAERKIIWIEPMLVGARVAQAVA